MVHHPCYTLWWGPPSENPSHSLALGPIVFFISRQSKLISVCQHARLITKIHMREPFVFAQAKEKSI